MNDVKFDLNSISFVQKSSSGLDSHVGDCAHTFERLCSTVETENAHFQNDCQREIKKVHEGINRLRSDMREIENKKKEALSQKQKEQPKPNPPSIPADCPPEQKNAIAKAYHQRVAQVEEQNAKIRKRNQEIDAYAKRCDEALPRIEEMIAKLQAIEDTMRKEIATVAARVSEVSSKAYAIKIENRFIVSSCASFNYALDRAYEMAQRIEMMTSYSKGASYDMSRQFTIKNTHSHISSGSIFGRGNAFSTTYTSNISYDDSTETTQEAKTVNYDGEITVTEKNSDAFFKAIKGHKKVAMPSSNIRFLGGKSFNAKMADLGYARVTQPDGSVIDKNGMIHWEKI